MHRPIVSCKYIRVPQILLNCINECMERIQNVYLITTIFIVPAPSEYLDHIHCVWHSCVCSEMLVLELDY